VARRHQLTLFVPDDAALLLEPVRAVIDPVQHRLIAAHVTLCREDELGDLDALRDRLAHAPLDALTLTFGRAEAFAGHGVLLPCVAGEDAFHARRRQVLGAEPRRHEPHLTLAHPRNPRVDGDPLEVARRIPPRLVVRFASVALIVQVGDAPWTIDWRRPLDGGETEAR
jgi:hypothetical protein